MLGERNNCRMRAVGVESLIAKNASMRLIVERTRGVVRRGVDVGRAVARLDAVDCEQRARQGVGAAAIGADVHAQTLELRQQLLGRSSIEDHQRLVRDAAQRHQLLDRRRVGFATQHEADIDCGLGVNELGQVVARAFTGQDVQRDALLGEDLLVRLGGAPEGAAVRPLAIVSEVGAAVLKSPNTARLITSAARIAELIATTRPRPKTALSRAVARCRVTFKRANIGCLASGRANCETQFMTGVPAEPQSVFTSMKYRPHGHSAKRSLSGLSLNAGSRSASYTAHSGPSPPRLIGTPSSVPATIMR